MKLIRSWKNGGGNDPNTKRNNMKIRFGATKEYRNWIGDDLWDKTVPVKIGSSSIGTIYKRWDSENWTVSQSLLDLMGLNYLNGNLNDIKKDIRTRLTNKEII